MKQISQYSNKNMKKLDEIDELIFNGFFIEASGKAIELTSILKKTIDKQKINLDKLLNEIK